MDLGVQGLYPNDCGVTGAGGVGGVAQGTVEVEEVQNSAARHRARSGVRSDEAVLHELDNGRVVHRNMRNIMPPRERRDHDVRQAEAKLRGKSITAARPRLGPGQLDVGRNAGLPFQPAAGKGNHRD